MKPLFLLLLLLTMCAQPQPPGFRECPCTHTDPEKRLYNQVLTELIEQRFYLRYLPDSAAEQVQQALNNQFTQSILSERDTSKLNHYVATSKRLEALQQNLLFNYANHFKTIYLDTVSRGSFSYSIKSFTKDRLDLEASDSLKSMVTQFGTAINPEMMASLIELQQHLSPTDFQLCTAKIAFRPAQNTWMQPNQIGVIRFSKIVFDETGTKALLTYDWTCGGTCGFAEAILVVKIKGNWQIKQHEMLWIA